MQNPNPHYDAAAVTDAKNPHYGDPDYTEQFYKDYTKEVKSFFTLRTMWWGYWEWSLANSNVNRLEGQINSRTNEYRSTIDTKNKIADIDHKLAELRRLAASRLLQGTLLNALQKTTVDDVQLIRLRVDQTYTSVEGTKARTNAANVVIKGRPPATTERIVVNLEGIDSSASPGDQVNRFKTVLATNAYFKDMLARTNPINLKSLSPLQVAPVTGKPCVMFTLECRYPEKTR